MFFSNSKPELSVIEQHKIYASLRILNILFNEGFGGFFFPLCKLVFGFYVVICSYGSIKLFHSGENPLIAFVLSMCALFMTGVQSSLYPKAAHIHKLSTKFSKMNGRADCPYPMGQSLETKYKCALVNSRVPISVKISSFYDVQGTTPLTYLSTVLSYTISFLIG